MTTNTERGPRGPIWAGSGAASWLMGVCGLVLAMNAYPHAVEAPTSLHGGITQAVGTVRMELVLVDGALRIYLYDRTNKPMPMDGVSAKALLWLEEGASRLALMPGQGVLQAQGSFMARAVRRVTVEVEMPGHAPLTAWFSTARDAETGDQDRLDTRR